MEEFDNAYSVHHIFSIHLGDCVNDLHVPLLVFLLPLLCILHLYVS